ncbi:MAG: hypothetical protein MUD10_00335 [Candidatus Pacebacteria bacterium]|jgi:hypothetical protein|nr:hypothetical protein [Candidatus Paceibacterota bacterium]
MKKTIVVLSLAFALCLAGMVPGNARASEYQMTAQIQSLQRQILLLRIQLIQQRIADLQRQLDEINSKSKKFIDVIYPNGGETLENNKDYYITWESRGIDKVAIKLERANSESTIAAGVSASDGRYRWDAGSRTGGDYRVKIYDSSDPGVSDQSGGNFTLFDNSKGDKCSDGTVFGKCSATKPKLCFDDELDLVDACHSCGCPSGETCRSDSTCR